MQIPLVTIKTIMVYFLLLLNSSTFCQNADLKVVRDSSVVKVFKTSFEKISGFYPSSLWNELTIDFNKIDSTFLTSLEIDKNLSLKISLLNKDKTVIKTKTLNGHFDGGYIVLKTQRKFESEYVVIWTCYSKTVKMKLDKSDNLLLSIDSSNMVFLILFPINGVGERDRVEVFQKK
jgi:hypothetical protein